jgi:indole-3-acetate monooxygenase
MKTMPRPVRPETQVRQSRSILDAVRELAPGIVARRDEIEQGRRLPIDLVDDLREAGCFRTLVPRTHGGAELALPEQMQVLEALSVADGSVGWTTMIGGAAPVLLGHLPPATFDAVYHDGPDVILGGAFNPTGVARPAPGGYRVTGKWGFASGCQHCHWFIAHCIVDDGRVPPLRMMVLPPDEIEIEDTWSVSGLRGTGSHDFVIEDVFVPEERTFSLFEEPPLPATVLRIPELSLSTLDFAAVALGNARGALDEIMALATGKVPAFSDSALAGNPLFRNQLGEADARLRAARALVFDDGSDAWATAETGGPFTLEQRARIRAAATWATNAAASVVETAYRAGSGSSLYASSPLQRRLRDANALTQHFALKLDTFTLAGAVLAGQDVDTTFL